MHTDPIADLLTRIRNGAHAHHERVTVPYSKIKEQILEVMKKYQHITDFKVTTEGKFKMLEITINEEKTDLTLRRVSKPGQRIYVKSADLKRIKNGLGLQILSTPKGILTNMEAKKQNVGGELICEIY